MLSVPSGGDACCLVLWGWQGHAWRVADHNAGSIQQRRYRSVREGVGRFETHYVRTLLILLDSTLSTKATL